MKPYTVNEVINLKTSLHGKRVYLEGLLRYGPEDISLLHWPKSEQKGLEVWIGIGAGAFCYNEEALVKLSGKRVVCLGEFQSTITEETVDFYWGFGHMGMWPAQIVATELVYYKRWYDAEGGLLE